MGYDLKALCLDLLYEIPLDFLINALFSLFSGFALKCHETDGDTSDDTLEECEPAYDSCGTMTRLCNYARYIK